VDGILKMGVTGYSYTSGDIFIDIDNDVVYGTDGGPTDKGYDYVFDVDWDNNSYNVYSIDQGTLVGVAEAQNISESNPWQFNPNTGAEKLYAVDKDFSYGLWSDADFLGDSYTGGDKHYYASGFDLSFIYLIDSSWDGVFTAHFTMQCGNDNLMGKGTAPVPEPATMLLLGTGLLALPGSVGKNCSSHKSVWNEID
jgi:hypothetical protein